VFPRVFANLSFVLFVTLALPALAPAQSQTDSIAARRESMKKIGAAMKSAGDMTKGATAFDAQAAASAMEGIAKEITVFPVGDHEERERTRPG
jgi:cytochrome c556